ncbi:site-2 protease family protein [Variovorax sp. H27-G14]|uniref:site-2 protease family protein n=1 Tax=Variovorax sp. H27-G14 TaxID=3111914 RepID=UPI0038FCDF9D
MYIALQFVAAIALLAALHVSVMALLGRALGIAIREVSFGMGPTLLAVGAFRLRALPLGGSVVFKDTLAQTPSGDAADTGAADAFDHQPRAVRVLLPLCGIAALAAVAFALHPGSAGASLANGFVQIVSGGLAPLSIAQQLINGATRVASLGFLPLLGMLAAKCAALNLLPLASMGGGQALLALLDPAPRETPPWKAWLLQASVWLLLALALSWAVAIGLFVTGR